MAYPRGVGREAGMKTNNQWLGILLALFPILFVSCGSSDPKPKDEAPNSWMTNQTNPTPNEPKPEPVVHPSIVGNWDFGTLTDGTGITYTFKITITQTEVSNNTTCTQGNKVAHAQVKSSIQLSESQINILQTQSSSVTENGIECVAEVSAGLLNFKFKDSNTAHVSQGSFEKDVYRVQ